MKYIVIGLGYFGGTLASDLIKQGHEVIGIDNNPDKVYEHKGTVSVAMEMDTTNPNALKTLPLDDVDAIIVAIGEDIGSSVLTLSILKNLTKTRIIGRAITPVHRNILIQIGIKEIVQPQEDSAQKVLSLLQIRGARAILSLNTEHAIAEIEVPEKYTGHSLSSINPEIRFNLRLVALKTRKKDILAKLMKDTDYQIIYEADSLYALKKSDYLVVAGKIEDIKRFIAS